MLECSNVEVEVRLEPLAVPISAASKLLGIGRTVTYELIKCGKLKTVHIGRRNMVRMSSLRELVGELA